MNNTGTSESFNDRQSISDASGVYHHLDASRSKYQPVRVNQLLSTYSSSSEDEDEDKEDKEDNSPSSSPPPQETKKASPVIKSLSLSNKIESSAPESLSGFTSDFGKADIDSTKKPSSGYIINRPAFQQQQQQQLYPDIYPPLQQDKHIHGKVMYKAENPPPPPPPSQSCQSLINKVVRLPQQQQQQQQQQNDEVNTETPMKHQPPAGSMRPVPSQSHRNIFQTPQGKMQSDYLASSTVQTPATILSLHNTLMRTPLQTRVQLETQQTPWQKNEAEKRVRRPLAETIPSHNPVMPPTPQQPVKKEDIHEALPPPPPIPSVPVPVPAPVENQSRQTNVEFKENHNPPSSNQQQQQQQQQQELKQKNNKQGNNNIQATIISSNQRPRVGDVFIVKKRRYMMLDTLGQGMSGQVYRVQDVESLELRAIKCVNLKLMEKEAAQSCIQEIKLLVKLQAPCIIRMYDYEIRDSIIYTVMEMGDTDLSKFLKEITAEKKRLPLTMILYYWTEMLTAVKHIHDNGVIHSDLKPANFLLVRGRLKLIDFGISSTLNADMTSVVKNSTVGTLNYISPESLKGVEDNIDGGGGGNNVGASPSRESRYKINFKSDVWSLGCILYSMVFGRTPFQHIRNQYGKINAIINPDVKISFKLSEPLADPIPSILIDVIRSCLQRNPKSRPSVDQLLQVHYFNAANNTGGGGGDPPTISQMTLRKIKEALEDDEWREFIHNMEKMRGN